MSDNSWVLKGVDAEVRQRAIEEAERRGVSLGDYLTEVVLRAAPPEQPLAQDAAPPDPQPATTTPAPESFPVRHRVEALERRVGLAVGGLDDAVQALDNSLFGLAERVDQAEALSAGTADLLNQTLQDAGAHFAALHQRLALTEEQIDTLDRVQDAMGASFATRCAGLVQHAAAAEDAARRASASTAQLATHHEALKYAVADDFAAFARESAARLNAGLDEVRTAAETAAEQADRAVTHLIDEFRTVREAVEARLKESAAETRLRVQAAFAEAAQRTSSLAERVVDCERLASRNAEQVHTRLAEIEDGAQTALEDTAESLRQAGAALAAEFARATEENRSAIESVHHDLTGEIAELREQQAANLARIKQADAVSNSAVGDLAALRQMLYARAAHGEDAVRAVLAQVQSDWDDRFDAHIARLAASEREALERHHSVSAQAERVEACALAALDKLANDRAAGDAALHRELGDIRDQGSGALARLALLDRAIGARDLVAAVEAGAPPLTERLGQIEAAIGALDAPRALDRGLDERLLRLEAAAESEETAHALAAVRGQLGALAAQLDAQQFDDATAQALDEMRARLVACEMQAGETSDRAQDVARALEGLTAQTSRAEERVHRLEQGLAEMRLETLPIQGSPPGETEIIRRIEQRVAEFEQRQGIAIAVLRGEIARFIDDSAQRFEALAQAHQGGDLAAEFESLRRRVEDRIVDVEQRSVRALEQVADTMTVLEKRFSGDPETALRTA